MRAALLLEQDQPLSIEEIELLPLGPLDALVRVDASGVCHSDLSVMRGWVPVRTPMILGHEGAGTVVEVGPGVSRVEVGNRVIAATVPTCGNCWFCVRDETHRCEAAAGITAQPRARRADGSVARAFTGLGTFADLMAVDEASLVAVDTDLPAEQLALIGCGVSTGVGAVLNTARVKPGSTVAVIGCGGVGQAIIQGARIAGAARILAIDPVELKRTTALRSGATDSIDPTDADPVAQVRALTGGRGADYAFEAVGYPETIYQAWEMARKGGMAVIVGMSRRDATVTFPALDLLSSDKTLAGSRYGGTQIRRDFPLLVDLANRGRLDLTAIVSNRITLDEVGEAFRAMDEGEVIRSVIV